MQGRPPAQITWVFNGMDLGRSRWHVVPAMGDVVRIGGAFYLVDHRTFMADATLPTGVQDVDVFLKPAAGTPAPSR